MNRLKILSVFGAMFLGVLAGVLTPAGSWLLSIYDVAGNLFLNALKLVIVPLVVSSIITGMAKMGEEDQVAWLGFKTFGFYSLTCITGILIGFLTVFFLEPGLRQEIKLDTTLAIADPSLAVSTFDRFSDILLKLFPPNIFQAAVDSQMLGLIVFSILFGFFTSKIEPQLSGTLQSFWKGVFQVMMKITQFIMKFLPFGVFALIAKVVSSTGFDALKSAGWFFATMMVAYLLYGLVALPLYLKFIANVNPLKHIQAMTPALLTAFTTSSSAATLPVTLETIEKRAGVSNRIAGFTLPIGTSFHMAGTAIFICVSIIFIAQAFGIPMQMADYVLIIVLSFIMSIGIAGIPSACLVAVITILTILKLPLEGIAILFVVERILDMIRTVMNVFSNTVCTVLIARSEKEHTNLQ